MVRGSTPAEVIAETLLADRSPAERPVHGGVLSQPELRDRDVRRGRLPRRGTAGGQGAGGLLLGRDERLRVDLLLAAAALLAVSGLTRLIEFWVLQGVGGVS